MRAASGRSASFTDWESEKTSAISGSKTTMFVPCLYRLVYFPRTPPEKSYSGKISGSGSVCFFFIISTFASGRRPGAYYPDGSSAIGVRHDQQSPAADEPMIAKRRSRTECLGSGTVSERGSSKTVLASSKETPCLLRFCLAFSESHSNLSFTPPLYLPGMTTALTAKFSARPGLTTRRSMQEARGRVRCTYVRQAPWHQPNGLHLVNLIWLHVVG
jgi:hypothetical protein